MGKFITGDVLLALKKIPSNSVDLGVTSPPYNKLEKNNGGLVSSVVYDKYKDFKSEDVYQSWQVDILNELYRIIKPGGSFFYNHKVRHLNGGIIHPMDWLRKTDWKVRQEIIWNRKIAGNIRGWRFWPIEERIYWLYKPRNKKDVGDELESRHALLTSIWEIRPEMKNKNHPAPFPLEIPARIIYSIFGEEKNKVVIDPFSGSGTTAVAADLLGEDYIGIDISAEYNKMARDRVKNDDSEIDIINREKKLHVVDKPYKKRKKVPVKNARKRS